MRSIVWWTVWGLVLAVGLLGLLEFPQNHYFLIMALPLLTGSMAAGLHRMQHEYKHAIEHAKWAGVSSLFLLASVGFLYAKAQAYGPFSTGSSHKALLGTTFGMSVPEVERTLGRPLREKPLTGAIHEKAHEWLSEALPLPGEKSEVYALPVEVFGKKSQITFQFDRKQLARVELQFIPLSAESAMELKRKLMEELQKDYRLQEESTQQGLSRIRFSKEAVEAKLLVGSSTEKPINLQVVLDYLPLAEQRQPALNVTANVF